MREVQIKLKLTSSWMGNPAGAIVKVAERQAKSMLSRKIAKIVIEDSEPVKVEAKLQKRDRDKMVKGMAVVNK